MSNLLPPNPSSLPPETNLRVEIHSGPLAGKGYPFLQDRLTMGRAPDNDISLDDVQVSRYHAILRRQDNQIILQDLGSTNGTLVNGERIYGEHILQPTETITVGASVLSVNGFPAPSTVSMATQINNEAEEVPWSTYQSGGMQAQQVSLGGSNWLLWGGLLALVILVFAIAGAAFILLNDNRSQSVNSIPVVVITSPVSGSKFRVDQAIFVQTTATDLEGVVRMELWAAGEKVDETASPLAEGQSPFTDSLSWTPQVEGSYTLEVRAFNSAGTQSAPTTININVETAGQPLSPSPESSPVPAGTPFATVRTDLNVRAGPGTEYDIIGALPANSTVQIMGRNEDNTWWNIEYPTGPERRAWIAAEFAPAQNAADVPLVDTPTPVPSSTPLPTASATTTPSPTPQATATPSPVPSDTPTPSPSPIPGATISFTADQTSIAAGQCARLSWKVNNVIAVYLNGEGVPGEDGGQAVVREVCPDETQRYELRVLKLDNQSESQEITIRVIEKLPAPGSFQVVAISEQSFSLSWEDRSDGEEGFRLYDADANRVLASFPANSSAGVVGDLNCNSPYRFYLVAYNSLAESAPSSLIIDQTATCP